MMEAWQATVQDEAGNVIFNPLVTVYQEDGTTLADIFNEDGSPKGNPFTGTIEGFVQFWAEAGEYKIKGVNGSDETEMWSVTIAAPNALNTSYASVAEFGSAGADCTSLVQMAVNKYPAVYIPAGYMYRRADLAVPAGVSIIDDSTGIRVTNQDYWWRPIYPRIRTIAHRTGMHLAPENTLAGISTAFNAGFDGIEIDINFTSDGVPVLLHDNTVDRTTNQTGPISAITYATAQSTPYECGSKFAHRFMYCRIPGLSDSLDYIRGKFEWVNIELKGSMTNSQIDTILSLVESRNMDESVVFISYSRPQLAYVRSKNKRVGIGYIDIGPGALFDLSKLGGRLYCSFTNAVLDANAGIVDRARAFGIEPFGKTTNELAGADRLLRLGINTIQSDNAILSRRPKPGGPMLSPCKNLAGTVNTVGSPSGSITVVRDEIIRISNSALGFTDTLNIPVQLRGGDTLDVDFYARVISGDPPIAYMGVSGFANPGLSLSNMAINDWYNISGRITVPGNVDNVANEPLRFGYGSGRSGTCEIMRVKVAISSSIGATRGNSVEALIELNSGTPVISTNWFPAGVVSAFYDTSGGNTNVVAIRIEGVGRDGNARTMFPTVQTMSGFASTNNYVAKYLNYNSPGTTDPTYACLRVGIYDQTGAPVELGTTNRGNLAISG